MLNKVVIMGRMVRDPELRRTANGVAVTSFTLAVDRDYVPQGQERESDFIDCVAWRNTGEFVDKHFSKGRMAVVFGSLQFRKWTDKDGNKRKAAEINVENVYFADSKRSENSTAGETENVSQNIPDNFEAIEDDDAQLPF